MIPQLCSPVDLNAWSFSPLPSLESPFLDTLLSSTYQDNSWNPFDRSFGSLMTPDSINTEFIIPEKLATKAYQDAYQNAYNNVAEPQQTEPWSVTQAASDCVSVSQALAGSLGASPPTRESYPSSPLEMQRGSGKSIPSGRTSSRSSRLSKRSKSQSKAGERETKSASQQRLRSTSTAVAVNSRPTTSSTSSYNSNSPPKHARLSHNQVEKQYRNRLNDQFETLLSTLPREDGKGSEEKKVSKAEVLMLARKYIRELERDSKRLKKENERLGGIIGGWKKRWVKSGGVVLS